MSTSVVAQQGAGDPERRLLAPGHKIYVSEMKDRKVNEAAIEALREWGRWTVVETRDQADIVLRLREVGHDAWRDQVSWGAKALEALLVDARDDQRQLWISKKQTGHRTIFHGYSSPLKAGAQRHHRANEGSQQRVAGAMTAGVQRWRHVRITGSSIVPVRPS